MQHKMIKQRKMYAEAQRDKELREEFPFTTEINQKSNRLLEKKLKLKLEEIFKLFDANNNGKISADEVCLDKVNAELLIVFKPLLIEMENFQEDLDKEEFIESALCLLRQSDLRSRNAVLLHGRKVCRSATVFDADLIFQPSITAKSNKLVTNYNQQPPEIRLGLKKAQYDEHKAELVKKYRAYELRDCTFKPNN